MAVWQVEFAIVPRQALTTTPHVPLSQVLDTDWWSGARLPAGHERQLSAIARLGASRATDRQTWGEEDGNRIDLWLENGKPARLMVRVDVRRLDAAFGARLLQFARIADAVLVRRDGLVIEPLVGAFGAALRSSEAWKYVADPAEYLASYSDEDEEPE